jgi:hypothetical protein
MRMWKRDGESVISVCAARPITYPLLLPPFLYLTPATSSPASLFFLPFSSGDPGALLSSSGGSWGGHAQLAPQLWRFRILRRRQPRERAPWDLDLLAGLVHRGA